MHVGWQNCPSATRKQLDELVDALRARIGGNLLSVYLHGSLALGCFNRRTSDLDILAVTAEGMPLLTRRTLIEKLLASSGSPHPIEISFLRTSDLFPWRHPCPYDLHFSESWRTRYTAEVADERWRGWQSAKEGDEDLAAHVTVTKQRGVCLWGQPIEALPAVPAEHFVAAIVGDFDWAADRLQEEPVYFVLNACRVYAYLVEGIVASKDEGGVWALARLPTEQRAPVVAALAAYRTGQPPTSLDEATLRRFVHQMRRQIGQAAARWGVSLPAQEQPLPGDARSGKVA